MKTINELKLDIANTFVPHRYTLDDTLFGNEVKKGCVSPFYEGEDILVVSDGEVYNMNYVTFLNFRIDASSGRLFYQGDMIQCSTLKEAMNYALENPDQVCMITRTTFVNDLNGSRQKPVYFVSYLE